MQLFYDEVEATRVPRLSELDQQIKKTIISISSQIRNVPGVKLMDPEAVNQLYKSLSKPSARLSANLVTACFCLYGQSFVKQFKQELKQITQLVTDQAQQNQDQRFSYFCLNFVQAVFYLCNLKGKQQAEKTAVFNLRQCCQLVHDLRIDFSKNPAILVLFVGLK